MLCNCLLEGGQVLRLQLLLHLVKLLLGQLAGLSLAQPLQLLPRGIKVRVWGLGKEYRVRGLESGQGVRIVGGPWDGLSSTLGGMMNPAYRAFSLITS